MPGVCAKGQGADDTASGPTRFAGSLNFKDKHAPNSPRVQVAYSSPGLMANVNQLGGTGMVAEPEKPSRTVYQFGTTERRRTGK